MLVYLCLSFEVMVVLYTSNLFGLCYIALPYISVEHLQPMNQGL